jgi:hypothetical protein
MAPSLHEEVLPSNQKAVWQKLQDESQFLNDNKFYLAGGTALALQIGHRQSVDFDFFTQQADIGESARLWTEQVFSQTKIRDAGKDTLHVAVNDVKVSLIGAYKYPTIEPLLEVSGNVRLASIVEIGLMKMLALTHRAALRDYIDLAVIFESGIELKVLLELLPKKYGPALDPMVIMRALTSFGDADQEVPKMFDQDLLKNWQDVIQQSVKRLA